jgi:hypothetical protein
MKRFALAAMLSLFALARLWRTTPVKPKLSARMESRWRGGVKELHDQMYEGRLRTKGDRQERQAARRRCEVQLHEEVRD